MRQNLFFQMFVKKDNGEEYIRVSFERPTEHGFDTVVFELPSYKIVEREGKYSDKKSRRIQANS